MCSSREPSELFLEGASVTRAVLLKLGEHLLVMALGDSCPGGQLGWERQRHLLGPGIHRAAEQPGSGWDRSCLEQSRECVVCASGSWATTEISNK